MGREGTSSASPAIYLRNTGSNKKQLLRFTNWKENKSNVIWIDKEDTSKFKKHTGWKPEISFEKTMLDLLNFWREEIKKGRRLLDR